MQSPESNIPVPADLKAELERRTSGRRGSMRLCDQVLAWHRAARPDDFGIVLQDQGYLPKLLAIQLERRQKKVSGNLDIEPIASSVPHTRFDPEIVRTKGGRKLFYRDASGAFRVHLGHGQFVHLLRCRISEKIVKEYVCGSDREIRALHLLVHAGAKNARTSLPRKGTWETFRWDNDTAYKRWKLHEHVGRFTTHPSHADLLDDIAKFFGNIDLWTRHGQPGFRKVLLTGPPGTGKTSMMMALAAERSRDWAFVLSDDLNFQTVCRSAAAKGIPTVIVIEEMDTLVHPSSDILNFLDGMTTPRNPAGTYLVATTNYPKAIDPRILQRPGRIHRVVHVGALRSRAAAVIARNFLPDDVAFDAKDLGRILDRTTPAEIGEIVGAAIRAVIGTDQPLTLQGIADARRDLKAALRRVDYRNRGSGFSAGGAGDDDPTLREEMHDRYGGNDDPDTYLDGGTDPDDPEMGPASSSSPNRSTRRTWGQHAASDVDS